MTCHVRAVGEVVAYWQRSIHARAKQVAGDTGGVNLQLVVVLLAGRNICHVDIQADVLLRIVRVLEIDMVDNVVRSVDVEDVSSIGDGAVNHLVRAHARIYIRTTVRGAVAIRRDVVVKLIAVVRRHLGAVRAHLVRVNCC